MSKPVSLSAAWADLMRDLEGCKPRIAPDNEHSYGAALAALQRCRTSIKEFRRTYPRLSRDKTAYLDEALRVIDAKAREVGRKRLAAGIKPPPKLLSVLDLLPGDRPRNRLS
jgi:hypothetical protein